MSNPDEDRPFLAALRCRQEGGGSKHSGDWEKVQHMEGMMACLDAEMWQNVCERGCQHLQRQRLSLRFVNLTHFPWDTCGQMHTIEVQPVHLQKAV